MSEKFQVLVLGGCGFVGRHLVSYLIENNLVSIVRVVDKVPPQIAWLNHYHESVFNSENVEFRSANLINQASCRNAFTSPFSSNCESPQWDFVFNCAAETRSGQIDAIYSEGIHKLSINCINEAKHHKQLRRYIEFSSANMLSTSSSPVKESSKIKPWTQIAQQKAKVENDLAKLNNNLNYTILRLPLVYGKGDRNGFTPRIIIASLYKYLGETMVLLWDRAMKMNTVHVNDVVAAAVELAQNNKANHQCVNVVDDSDSTQGSIADLLSDIFHFKTNYLGSALSEMTKLDLSGFIDEINDKHLIPWAELCQMDQIENTPLTPYMHSELLQHKHLYVSNEKLKSFSYHLKVPFMKRELIEEIILDFIAQGIFPRSIMC